MVHFRRHLIRTITGRRFVRYSILTANIVLLVGVFLYVSQNNSQAMQTPTLPAASTNVAATPLDQLSSADIAVNIAKATGLAETTAIANQADSANADQSIASVASTVVSEPQVVATAFKSRFDVQPYVVQNGDTVSSIAQKFNVTSDSIRWSNGLTGDTVSSGTKLQIPPMNGIVYTVKQGDTVASLAQKYSADQAQLTEVNDTEISGLQPGEQIVIPNGQEAAPVASSAASYLGISASSLSASYAGFGQCSYGGKTYSNYGYDCGFCTWWAAFRRAQAGEPVPSNLGEAYSWRYTAAAMGIPEGNKPQAGAVIWFSDDHVAYVESVASDGTTTISEMNHLGWGVMDNRTFSPSQAESYTYIY